MDIKSQIDQFKLYLKLDLGLAQKSIESYSTDITDFLTYSKGNAYTYKRHEIQKYLEHLKNRKITNRSLARKLSAIKRYFKFCLNQNLCTEDPTEGIHSPKIGKALPKTLSMQEVEDILNAPESLSDQIMLRTLYASGLRVSEIISVTPDQIDLNSGIIRIQGKGDKVRLVPFDEKTAELLVHYSKNIRPELLKKNKKAARFARSFFLSTHGHSFTRQGFWKLIRKYAKKVGIRISVSPHVLRHAFATHLLEGGMNLRTLQMLLGHSDISTTEVYSHISNSHLHDVIRKYHPRSRSS